ncbi:hypothetical protein SAMN04488038_11149 [Solimonas aquatica]|uniref:DUF4440 domain-containing protein n=1 Tax=Solimonas aquatica TaxID=489703 RepID=A0A1H9J7S1_9GAMM|nr:DUF4440 domain-containing protein [Solimonas aquatica]SEQ82832.1 hypothetical protein SAMN04488038_11149 [Solimonas aquatica]
MTDLLQHLRTLEAELHHPGVACSGERLAQLLHPQFHEVGRSGRRYDRDTVIAHLAQARGPTALAAQDYVLQALGPDCALLCYQSLHREGDGTQTALRASIWRRTPQGWQLFYHQGTAVPR